MPREGYEDGGDEGCRGKGTEMGMVVVANGNGGRVKGRGRTDQGWEG